MSTETQKLIEICEQLPEAKQIEVTDFAQFLLSKSQGTEPRREAMQRWLKSASGVAKPGITTDQIMKLTRGEL